MISRYVYPEMGQLWSEEEKYASWLKVEVAACKAWAEKGKIPEEAVRRIEKKARFSVEQIEEYEKETRHDVIAFIQCVSLYIGEDARYFHFGLTSSDILDTSLALRMKKGLDIIIGEGQNLLRILEKRAIQHKNTIMLGRTHGIHAEPTTFGLKLLLYYEELKRNLQRLRYALHVISVGKLAGAVGTLSHLPPDVEEKTMDFLGLKVEPVSSQIVQRDRHAEVVCALALMASGLEKIATEIRNLQRSDINEVREPFMSRQKGSSAMPHKKNPIICERICGLSRLVRSQVPAALENIPLWHERDISHSSVERIILPDVFCLVHYMLKKMQFVTDGLVVLSDNMRNNLKANKGLVFSQKILLYLVDKGLSRKEAYDIVQRNALKCLDDEKSLLSHLKNDTDFMQVSDSQEIDALLQYDSFLTNIDAIYERSLGNKGDA